MNRITGSVTSSDGTRIAFERFGDGPPLLLVDGALCTRSTGAGIEVAPLLADTFSVYVYDRRGRGDSGDSLPYAVEREVEDLAALVEHAGGSALLFGSSSGATLALEAARRGLPIERLALYEAPMIVDDSRPPVGGDYLSRIQALVDAGRAGDAIKVFLREGIRVPAPFVFLMPLLPAWSRLKAVADTLAYDTLIVEEYLQGKQLAADRWHSLAVPTLVSAGSMSPHWMQNAMRALADALPNAEHRTLAGQTHMVKPTALAPVLAGFLSTPKGRNEFEPSSAAA